MEKYNLLGSPMRCCIAFASIHELRLVKNVMSGYYRTATHICDRSIVLATISRDLAALCALFCCGSVLSVAKD